MRDAEFPYPVTPTRSTPRVQLRWAAAGVTAYFLLLALMQVRDERDALQIEHQVLQQRYAELATAPGCQADEQGTRP